MRNDILLFHPGDGVRETSNEVLYKGIKDFKKNPDGTITFKTQKHGTITTAELWRLKENVADDEPAAAPAGNMARARGDRY